jgi:PKD repeat protein
MKRILTLWLLLFAAFNFQLKAQTGTTCNADFSFQYITSNTLKFTPVVIGDSANTQHYWKFGNGNVANTPLATHTYTATGTYNVTHIIIKYNPNGIIACVDSVTKPIIIQSLPCSLQTDFTSYDSSANPLIIQFINSSYGYEATDSIRWSFGDGTVLNGLISNWQISLPVHTYANAGTYTVCLRIKKNTNAGTTPCVSEICKQIVVASPCNFVAYFSAQPDTSHPLRIKFNNLSTPISATDSVRWTFGDGSAVNGLQSDPNIATPTHNYTHAGIYTVCIRVKKNVNATSAPCVREFCKTITVSEPCNFQVSFTLHRDSLNTRKVHFTNTTMVTTTNAIAKWSFGDGTYGGTWNAIHEYAQPGTYRVCLSVQTTPNCVKETYETIVIPQQGPACKDLSQFKFEKASTDNQQYKFTPDNINTAVVYTWTFGDGTGSHDPIAMHRYSQPGIYIACLTAWRGPNCASTTCKEMRVLPQLNCDSIHVSYMWQKDALIPNKIHFAAIANLIVLDQTWTITQISPAITTPIILHQNNPVFTFADTGYYRVCLKAITLGGCVKEYCSVIKIEKVAPVCMLQVFPNPASTSINVAVQLTQPEIIHAYVYNSTNILVKEKQLQGVTGNNMVTININDLVSGLYTIKVVYGSKTCYARFTKL